MEALRQLLQEWEDGQQNCLRVICRRGPDEGAMRAIVVVHKRADLLDQILYAAERTAANGSLGNQGKPALHLNSTTKSTSGCSERGNQAVV